MYIIKHTMTKRMSKLKEIEMSLLNIYQDIKISKPENHGDILKFVYKDVCKKADILFWSDDDVAIAFSRWIESQKVLKPEIWIGQIPGICGYGISVVAFNEQDALKALKKSYYEMSKAWKLDKTFEKAMDYYGGSVFEVEPCHGYFDDFKS
jgi:hypothetical protein